MQKYKIGKALGDGTFGSVTKAINSETNQVVAIKKMKHKFNKWDDCINLNQIKALIKFHHPNIVNLYEVIKENNQLYFVFQYMNQNVYQLIKDLKTAPPEVVIRNVTFQTLQGLAYMHKHGYFHRDMKPENLLQSNGMVKIADFGLARQIRAKPPFTEYVSTRWYRAPQVILRSTTYNSPVDIFAVGAIMAEMYRLYPLFPGSSQRDQMLKICQVLGTPTQEEWPDGYKLAAKINYLFPQCQAQSLQDLIPQASASAISLMKGMLAINPHKRLTAVEALQHPYFQVSIPLAEDNSLKFNKKEQKNQNKTLKGIKNARYRPNVVCELTTNK